MFDLQYFVIGFLQGITEFLPISSSGHLVLISQLTNWEDQGLFTDVAVHTGTLFAVLIYLRKEIYKFISQLISFNLIENQNLFKIIIATIPSLIVGFFIFDIVKVYFRDLKVVAISSIVFAIFLFISDRIKIKKYNWHNMNITESIIVGLFQTLAFIPGASRAGVTISGARFLGYDRSNAVKFSMLLSIPIILASLILTTLDILNSERVITNINQSLLASLIACITALISINLMMKLITFSNFNIFIIYRILLGFILLFFYA